MKDELHFEEFLIERIDLRFKTPARTSRNTLHSKPSWILRVRDKNGKWGWGECSVIPGLSLDQIESIERFLNHCKDSKHMNLSTIPNDLPAVRFALEMVQLSLHSEESGVFYEGPFVNGKSSIDINGLIWMDTPEAMLQQGMDLAEAGFQTLKMKVGTLPFDTEMGWLRELRQTLGDEVVLRCDANGAFSKEEKSWTPLRKLEALAQLDFHSIEQPLKQDDWEGLASLCSQSPIPIGLDESLIEILPADRVELLDRIAPQFLILKPSLIGGFEASQHWVDLADERGIGWWATSALESNLGLYAIAQWVSDGVRSDKNTLHQGLGTGALFTNNLPSSMKVDRGKLTNERKMGWNAIEHQLRL
ncbi:MAG: o-succinylbenzoate synthase [Flavobacteriales bacterium]